MSAAMLFHTLRSPARYTVGYMGVVQAGVWTDIREGHAWTEAYIDGAGWVFVEATGGDADNSNPADPDDGKLPEPGPAPEPGAMFFVKPIDDFRQYDGAPLIARARIQGIYDLLRAGYTYKTEVHGSQTEIGYGTSVIDRLAIYDPDGSLVYEYRGGSEITNTSEYNFTVGTGKLHVYKYRIAVITGSGRKPYDGTPLTHTEDCGTCVAID